MTPLGVAERLNRTLLDRIRAFTHESGVPETLWDEQRGEALRHAIWLKIRTATRALDGKTAFEASYCRPPDLSNVLLWGCPAWMHGVDGSKGDVPARQAK
jgi:hypothetical protein